MHARQGNAIQSLVSVVDVVRAGSARRAAPAAAAAAAACCLVQCVQSTVTWAGHLAIARTTQ